MQKWEYAHVEIAINKSGELNNDGVMELQRAGQFGYEIVSAVNKLGLASMWEFCPRTVAIIYTLKRPVE